MYNKKKLSTEITLFKIIKFSKALIKGAVQHDEKEKTNMV